MTTYADAVKIEQQKQHESKIKQEQIEYENNEFQKSVSIK